MQQSHHHFTFGKSIKLKDEWCCTLALLCVRNESNLLLINNYFDHMCKHKFAGQGACMCDGWMYTDQLPHICMIHCIFSSIEYTFSDNVHIFSSQWWVSSCPVKAICWLQSILSTIIDDEILPTIIKKQTNEMLLANTSTLGLYPWIFESPPFSYIQLLLQMLYNFWIFIVCMLLSHLPLDRVCVVIEDVFPVPASFTAVTSTSSVSPRLLTV